MQQEVGRARPVRATVHTDHQAEAPTQSRLDPGKGILFVETARRLGSPAVRTADPRGCRRVVGG